MYLTKTPGILKPIASDLVWDIPTDEKVLYLTFDDGPHPGITPDVLRILDQFGAKATFFCVGANIERFPEVFDQVSQEGHAVGNHTFNHESGWDTANFSYLRSYIDCQKLTENALFRPPYGRIKREQVRALKHHTNLIMWDVLSGDFDPKRSAEKCAETVIKHARGGSIVVFHDSMKARENVLGSLPVVLKHFSENGFSFRPIDSSQLRYRKR